MDLTQEVADELLAMEKEFVTQEAIDLHPGVKFARDLRSSDGREQFVLDFYQGTLRINKLASNHRYARTIILVRLCLNGPRHTNPDGQIIEGSHLHVYREGYGDKWADPLDPTSFHDPSDTVTSMYDFLAFLRIRNPPVIQGSFI